MAFNVAWLVFIMNIPEDIKELDAALRAQLLSNAEAIKDTSPLLYAEEMDDLMIADMVRVKLGFLPELPHC